MKSSLFGYVYKILWDRTRASSSIFHQTLLSTWFLAGPNLVPEMDAIFHTIVAACPSFLSSWKTVHPFKTSGRHLLFETFSDYSERVHHISFCLFCVLLPLCVLSGLCEIFKVREQNLLVWVPMSWWGLGSHSSLML